MFIVYFSKMAKKRKNVGTHRAQTKKKTRNQSKSTEDELEKCASTLDRSKSPGSVSSETPSLESVAGKFTVLLSNLHSLICTFFR